MKYLKSAKSLFMLFFVTVGIESVAIVIFSLLKPEIFNFKIFLLCIGLSFYVILVGKIFFKTGVSASELWLRRIIVIVMILAFFLVAKDFGLFLSKSFSVDLSDFLLFIIIFIAGAIIAFVMADLIEKRNLRRINMKLGEDFVIVEKDSFKVVGRRALTKEAAGTWRVAREDGSIKMLESLKTEKPFLGLCFGFKEDGKNDYMVGIEYAEDIPGLEAFTYPKHSWLVYELDGKISEDVLGNAWWYINNKILKESKYTKDNLPTLESYVEWNEEKNYCKVKIMIPYIIK